MICKHDVCKFSSNFQLIIWNMSSKFFHIQHFSVYSYFSSNWDIYELDTSIRNMLISVRWMFILNSDDYFVTEEKHFM